MPVSASRKDKPATRRRATVGAVDHAIDLLWCLSEAGTALGTNDVARRIGIHKSSVSRLAATLEKARLVQRDPGTGRLSLGMGLITLAAPVLATFEVRDVVRPILEKLAEKTGETVSFGVWDGHQGVSIEQVPGSNSVRAFSRPGHRDPAHATAVGKILLAHQDEATIDGHCARPLKKFTDTTITSPAALKAELLRCRTLRYAINSGEFESDIGAVSSIVFDAHAQPLGAITATVPMYRFKSARRAELAETVSRAAAELSRKLGFPG